MGEVYTSFMCFGIPVDNVALFVAEVAEQGRSGRAETKDRIFHDGLARTHRGKEIAEVIIAVAVSGRGYIFLVSQLRRSHGVGAADISGGIPARCASASHR